MTRLAQIAATMKRVESWKPGSVSQRLNNPGNLIFAGQPGATRSSISFKDAEGRVYYYAKFETVADGEFALERQIVKDAGRGMTIEQFAHKYAPPGKGNNPDAYAQYIASTAGLAVSDGLALAIAEPAQAGPVAEAAD